MTGPVRLEVERDGAVARLVLARPKANILDAAMVGALRESLVGLERLRGLRLLVLAADGPHFSFGASVEEHLPGQVESMLAGFHAWFREVEALGVPTAAVVRGQCLGGGFELATACGRVYCDPTARFAVPEIKLGVFPPVAAVLLPWRVRGPEATRLLLSGAPVDGEEATRLGVADVCSEDPEAALWRWYDDALAPLSAVAVRMAWRAHRRPVVRALTEDLPAVERLYLEELMAFGDPVRGLTAFLAKTPPHWEHR